MGAVIWGIFPLALVILCYGCHGNRFCAHHVQPPHRGERELDLKSYILQDEKIQSDNKTIRCNHDDKYCFIYWGLEVLDDGNLSSFLIKGCWNVPDSPGTCLDADKCIASWGHQVQSSNLNKSLWCCCESNMCNQNMTPGNMSEYDGLTGVQPMELPAEFVPGSPNYKQRTIFGSLFSVSAVAVIVCVSYLIYRKCLMPEEPKIPPPPDNSSMYLVKSPSTPSFVLDELKFCSIINRGRFGEVWKGTLDDIDVAIKVFTTSQRSYYLNERSIYLLPHMDHNALLHFYGSEERLSVDGNVQYIIVMNLVPAGNLTCYLKNNILDWSTMCRMANSITKGIAYLHSEIDDHESPKPAIAHRDLNTRNILVNCDLSCSLCDFGFAMKIKRINFLRDGAEDNLEQTSLTDVGTLRYMAPEVLEGAVNLRDCESSLKQIDVYALGLVIWELASRCSDLYQGMPVPEYTLPFQTELGLHPSFEEMQLLVTKSKARPKFPNVWKDSNQAIRALKETIDDCWDQDGEARLTALCADERVLEMTALWGLRPKGVTPTMLTSALGNLEEKTDVQHNLTQSAAHHDGAPFGNFNLGVEVSQMSEPINDLSQSTARRAQRTSYTDTSMSAASTMETTVSPSEFDDPLSPHVPNKGNCNLLYARQSRVLQPHQGQNPTVERNTHKHSDEDVTIMGNTLVSKSNAISASTSGSLTTGNSSTSHASRHRIPNTTATLTDELMGAISDNLESSLVQNDLLNQSQRHHLPPAPPQMTHAPIPYLQNQVHQTSASEPLIVRPKQPNLPGNGSTGSTYSRAMLASGPSNLSAGPSNLSCGPSNLSAGPSNLTNSNANNTQKQGWFGKLMKPKSEKKELNTDSRCQRPLLGTETKVKDKKSSSILSFPFFGKSSTGSSTSSLYSSVSPSSSASSRSEPDPHVPTVVRMVNGAAVVRPTSLPVAPSSQKPNRNSWHTEDHSGINGAVPNGVPHGGQPCKVSNVKQINSDNQPVKAETGAAQVERMPGHIKSGTNRGRVKSRSSSDLTPSSMNDGNLMVSNSIQLSDLEGNKWTNHKPSQAPISSQQSNESNASVHCNIDDVFEEPPSASTAFSDHSMAV